MNKIRALLRKWLFSEELKHVKRAESISDKNLMMQAKIRQLKHELMITRIKLTKARNKIKQMEAK
jgi:hypothetical protein